MNYEVVVVQDDELPQGRNVVIVEREDGAPLLLINGPHARAWRMMRAYEDKREPCTAPTVLNLASPLLRAV